jgi:hypothetical protein
MKLNEQYASWNDGMYQYLSWCLFEKVYGTTEWYENEEERIRRLLKKSGSELSIDQCKIVENRALRLGNEYNEWSLEHFNSRYGYDLDDINYGEDDFRRAPINYDNNVYLAWTDAVRRKHTVKMTYDSTTSGISERFIDPYKTSAPYGEGYCHNHKEVRKFRFDRIINIELTKNTFIKPRDWKSNM